MILKLYIQRTFWEKYAYFDTQNREDKYWQNFKQWIFDFMCEYELILECEDSEKWLILEENEFISALFDKKAPRRTPCEPNLSTKMQELSFYQIESYPFRFFFTHENKETCTTLAQRFGFMYFTLSELATQWKTFYSLRPDAKMVVTKSPNQPSRFDSWTKLQEFKYPLNSILIFDNYILQEKEERRFINNLYPLLKNMLLIASKEITISLIIFAEKAKMHRIVAGERQTNRQIPHIHNDLLQFLNRIFPDYVFQIKIVAYDVERHQILFDNPNYDKIHDRYLITNYFCIESSGGFDLFKPNGEVAKTTKITFDFHFHSLNTNYITFVLNNIKSYIGIAGISYYPNTVPVTHPFLT